MPSMPLPAGSVVETRFFAPIRLPPGGLSDLPAGFEELSLPQALIGPEGQAPVGFVQRARTAPLPHEAGAPGTGLLPGDASLSLVVVSNRMAVVELVFQWKAGPAAHLDGARLGAHWNPFYENFSSFVERATEGTTLSRRQALWQGPLTTVVLAEGAEVEAILPVALEALGGGAETLGRGNLAAAMSWDGTIAALAIPEEQPAVVALMRLIVVDWELHDEARADARRLLLSEGDAQLRLETVRSTLRRFHAALVLLDPTWFCYQDSDRAFVALAWAGWGRQEEHARTVAAMDRVERSYTLEADAQRELSQRESAAKAETLNRVVTWLGLLGVTSTVAGILSTIDYGNELVDHGGRIAWIGGSAVLAVGAFVLLIAWRRS